MTDSYDATATLVQAMSRAASANAVRALAGKPREHPGASPVRTRWHRLPVPRLVQLSTPSELWGDA